MAGKGKPGPNPQFSEKMNFRVAIVVTEKQLKAIQEAAEMAGETASTWARKIVLAAIPKGIES
jgi:hypothetical protein